MVCKIVKHVSHIDQWIIIIYDAYLIKPIQNFEVKRWKVSSSTVNCERYMFIIFTIIVFASDLTISCPQIWLLLTAGQ